MTAPLPALLNQFVWAILLAYVAALAMSVGPAVGPQLSPILTISFVVAVIISRCDWCYSGESACVNGADPDES
jgi:hypothetical protein